jgi:hypothetical protein
MLDGSSSECGSTRTWRRQLGELTKLYVPAGEAHTPRLLCGRGILEFRAISSEDGKTL